jgi:aspartate racemase
MRTLGIVGGLGPDSTVDYYLSIIESFRHRVGDDSSPHIVIDSLDVRRGIRMLDDGALDDLADYIAASIERLAKAGADLAVIAANTPHIVFDRLEAHSPIPLISIVRATRDAALAAGSRRPALLGTGFTMSGDFYPTVFAAGGITLIPPQPEERARIHEIYVGELLNGKFTDEARDAIAGIIDAMIERDAIDAIVMAGTELPLLLRERDLRLPILDTTRIHVAAVVKAIV